MGLGAPRLIFLVLLVVNCILWSNSRYAEVSTSHRTAHISLVKRSLSSQGQITALLNGSVIEDEDEVRQS